MDNYSPAGLPDTVTPLGGEVYEIDTRLAGYDGITAGYLIRSDRPCLVETGTSTSAPVVRDSLHALGIGPGDLATIVVTHIHLDHAGGVGDLAAMFPSAEIVVHQKGARHLADPSRLMRSARTVWGDRMELLFGEMLPTEAARIRAVDETGEVDLGGGRSLSSHYSPGHAKHHVGLIDSHTGDLYVGDAVGVYLPATGEVRPATPPPDFDLDASLASLRLFHALAPQRLLFAHYGPVDAVPDTLDRSAEELRVWVDLVREARGQRAGDLDHAVAMVREKVDERYRPLPDTGDDVTIDTLAGVEGNVTGIMHWLDRLEQERGQDRTPPA
ncbi:MBL fold metallo-hydrolase [Allonocardiopsis opalescens]|uniref:Glyoxylase-like metal-dependent hydrolase (Beta-lactamase superfamily II) n=1 Tax=Allonocardiopsis opalescens TaxID=1144618 RepID=A0A2T0PPW5_9ACTN|nr:MBL fold metallo-hydrolase [Allonocardiopsis opalescens]PRX90943.1 glyoxylase-like metal-dependent hydrolase (beta-lactamase superfamily II) [Allonocardiopsis opalescens]